MRPATDPSGDLGQSLRCDEEGKLVDPVRVLVRASGVGKSVVAGFGPSGESQPLEPQVGR